MTSAQVTTFLGLVDTALASCSLVKGKFADLRQDGAMYHSSGYIVVPTSLNTSSMSAERVSQYELRLRLQIAWACQPTNWTSVLAGAISAATDACVALNGVDWSSSLSPTVLGTVVAANGVFEYIPEGVLYFSVELPVIFRRQRT